MITLYKYFIHDNQEQRLLFKRLIDICFDFWNGKTRNGKVLIYKSPDWLKNKLSSLNPKRGIKEDKILDILRDIGKYSISQSDVNYLAFPDSSNSLAGMMAEIYTKFLNQNMIAFSRSAPYATFIEIQLIEWLRQLIGYDFKNIKDVNSLAEVGGMCTTGGHMSNHISILAALNHKYPQIKENGLNNLGVSPKIILAGKISHYSYSSAMHHLGLGNNNIISTESTTAFTTDLNSLRNELNKHRGSDDVFMVVAVAGNSRTCGIDDIEAISNICKEFGVWLHVDACHGGSLIFSDKLKNKHLKRIETADSISIDPHKGMFVTYPLSYVLFKKRDSLVPFTRYESQVRSGEAWDLGYTSPFYGSRGFESLKLWTMIRSMGFDGLRKAVEKREGDAIFVQKYLTESEHFILFHEMTFYRLAFVFYPNDVKNIVDNRKISLEQKKKIRLCIDNYTHKINDELYKEGTICLDEFKLHDIANITNLESGNDRFYVMSVTTGNPTYSKKSLKRSLDVLITKSKNYSGSFRADIIKILNSESYSVEVSEGYGPASWK
ncbi:hypothetical protein HZB69_03180 [Candidatus Amesbacteria bacterium]|nr:hypothetical protein [Candidatus Amesbacteria bacterium]